MVTPFVQQRIAMTLLCLKTPAYMVMGCGYIICDVHNNQFSNHTACRLNDQSEKSALLLRSTKQEEVILSVLMTFESEKQN